MSVNCCKLKKTYLYMYETISDMTILSSSISFVILLEENLSHWFYTATLLLPTHMTITHEPPVGQKWYCMYGSCCLMLLMPTQRTSHSPKCTASTLEVHGWRSPGRPECTSCEPPCPGVLPHTAWWDTSFQCAKTVCLTKVFILPLSDFQDSDFESLLIRQNL